MRLKVKVSIAKGKLPWQILECSEIITEMYIQIHSFEY